MSTPLEKMPIRYDNYSGRNIDHSILDYIASFRMPFKKSRRGFPKFLWYSASASKALAPTSCADILCIPLALPLYFACNIFLFRRDATCPIRPRAATGGAPAPAVCPGLPWQSPPTVNKNKGLKDTPTLWVSEPF